MKKFVGMAVEEVLKALEGIDEEVEVSKYESGEVYEIMVGEYWSSHAVLYVEDGVVDEVEYEDWD